MTRTPIMSSAATSANVSAIVVDDDPAVRMVLSALLTQAGVEAAAVDSAHEALALLDQRPFEVMITDLRMPGMDGMDLLERMNQTWPSVPVVMLTAHGTISTAVDAMKRGAADFLLKPFDREELIFVVRKVAAQARYADREVLPAPPGARSPPFTFGESPAMRDCQALIERAAAGSATVLLRGESGTGKEVAARAVHQLSPRRTGPFVGVHCGALPDALLESELFGYEKGAFTGAATRKPGRVELAQGGTLFLDEIGDITAAAQVKLLRLLQERSYERLGGTATLAADVRFIAATHRDLEGMVSRGQFREDLFYRLSVVPIWLPPLRARTVDIQALARRFCAERGAANGRPGVTLDASALAMLSAQTWPGNVRELQNFIERLVVLSVGTILTAADVAREVSRAAPLSGDSRGGDTPVRLEAHRKRADREALENALQHAQGNRALAARLLGVSRRTLYNKLAELGLR
jgi:two-component system response regulator AtoC